LEIWRQPEYLRKSFTRPRPLRSAHDLERDQFSSYLKGLAFPRSHVLGPILRLHRLLLPSVVFLIDFNVTVGTTMAYPRNLGFLVAA
jgi:hypothetical protein